MKRMKASPKNKTSRKQEIVDAFNKGAQDNTRIIESFYRKGEEYSYPIPFGKFTIDKDFGRKEICIRCKKCWTDELIKVAKKLCVKFSVKVSSPLGVSGFGTAYNFFTIHI